MYFLKYNKVYNTYELNKIMKITYDKEANAAYISLKDINAGEVKRTVELKEDIMLDFDKQGKLIGIEILNASKIMNKEVLAEAEQI